MSIKEAIYDLADEYGSSAPHVGTKLDAIDALTDALAGENKAKSKSVEEAVANLKSYLPSGATLGTKTITANDTYTAAADDLDGYSSVTVNVPSGGWTPGQDLVEIWRDDDELVEYVASTDADIEHVISIGTIGYSSLAGGTYFSVPTQASQALYWSDGEGGLERIEMDGQAVYGEDPCDVYLIPMTLPEGKVGISVGLDYNLTLDNQTSYTVKYRVTGSGTDLDFPAFVDAGDAVTVRMTASDSDVVVSYTPEGGSKTAVEYLLDVGWRFTMPDSHTVVTVEPVGGQS